MNKPVKIIMVFILTALLFTTLIFASCIDANHVYSVQDRETIGIFSEQLKYTTIKGQTFYSYKSGDTVFSIPSEQKQPEPPLIIGHAYKVIWHYSSEKFNATKLVTSWTDLGKP